MQQKWLIKSDSSELNTLSQQIRNIKSMLNLSVSDLEKTTSALWELDRITSSPLYFETAADRKEHIIRNIRSIVERTIDNADFLAGTLIDQIYEDAVQLENAISETYESINARFSFWFYSLQKPDKPCQEIQTFTEFTKLFIDTNVEHAYFLLPFESSHSLVCQYIPNSNQIADIKVHTSDYFQPFEGSLQGVKKVWAKLVTPANARVYHIFNHHARSNTAAEKNSSSLLVERYHPHKDNQLSSIPKILYDFINMHSINNRRHVHLIHRDDKSAVLLTQRPIEHADGYFKLSREDATDICRPDGLMNLLIE
ncbi:TPA: hypothetical protein EYO57_30195 [Candidatus Poribacteria bacterium]|nr:hypothetical protein [Candidatus Poribacteria bacterium]HIM09200.1 hypothetical protein [Candidatus Poribacteria bacterium]